MILLNSGKLFYFSGKPKVIKILFFFLTAWKWLNYIRVLQSHGSWNKCLTNHQSKYYSRHFYKASPSRPQVLEHWAFILQMRKLGERKEKHGSHILLVTRPQLSGSVPDPLVLFGFVFSEFLCGLWVRPDMSFPDFKFIYLYFLTLTWLPRFHTCLHPPLLLRSLIFHFGFTLCGVGWRAFSTV